MSSYCATVHWKKQQEEKFVDNQYSRHHLWRFDGGLTVPASSSPDIVPLPYSVAENVDPEEAFIAALSSCHMLFFLSLCAKKGWVVTEYADEAVGLLTENAEGKMAMTEVTLKPKVLFEGDKQPSEEELEGVHHRSHELCFIANSVKSEIKLEPVY